MTDFTVELPPDLWAEVARWSGSVPGGEAAWVVEAVREKLTASAEVEYLEKRAARGDRAAFDRVLDKVPAVPPLPGEATMDKEEIEHKEVYTHFGAAAARLQTLDTILTNIFLVNGRVRGPERTAEELNDLEESLRKKTLGQLIAEARKHVALPERAAEAFKLALARRNFLIHHFMRERAFEFATPAGRARMIEELREMQAVAIVANRMADEFCEGMAKVLGITPQLLESQAQELREQAIEKESRQGNE